MKKSSKGVLVDDIHEQIIIHNDVKQEPLFDTEEGKELIKPVDNDYARTLIQYELEKYKIVKGKNESISLIVTSCRPILLVEVPKGVKMVLNAIGVTIKDWP